MTAQQEGCRPHLSNLLNQEDLYIPETHSSDDSVHLPARKRKMNKQPSPFELDLTEEEPTRCKSKIPAARNRKTLHSLIERRRREKINDCLVRLCDLVPACQESILPKRPLVKPTRRHGERADQDFDCKAQVPLSKLEILQRTIAYIGTMQTAPTVLPTQDFQSIIQSGSSSEDAATTLLSLVSPTLSAIDA